MYFIHAIHNSLYIVHELFLSLESFKTSADGFEMIVITDQLL